MICLHSPTANGFAKNGGQTIELPNVLKNSSTGIPDVNKKGVCGYLIWHVFQKSMPDLIPGVEISEINKL